MPMSLFRATRGDSDPYVVTVEAWRVPALTTLFRANDWTVTVTPV